MSHSLERILYVDDELDFQEVGSLALESIGNFTIKVCKSGQEALEEVVHFDPDLLLLDVMMPIMDGPTTLRKIRQIAGMETIPFIFMTSKIQPHEVAQYRKMGALDVIPKPFDPMTLACTIRAIWEKK